MKGYFIYVDFCGLLFLLYRRLSRVIVRLHFRLFALERDTRQSKWCAWDVRVRGDAPGGQEGVRLAACPGHCLWLGLSSGTSVGIWPQNIVGLLPQFHSGTGIRSSDLSSAPVPVGWHRKGVHPSNCCSCSVSDEAGPNCSMAEWSHPLAATWSQASEASWGCIMFLPARFDSYRTPKEKESSKVQNFCCKGLENRSMRMEWDHLWILSVQQAEKVAQ